MYPLVLEQLAEVQLVELLLVLQAHLCVDKMLGVALSLAVLLAVLALTTRRINRYQYW
jgi:hypothetical protein